MFFSLYLIFFSSLPYILKFGDKELKYHFNFTIFLIIFLSFMSINGPDLTTYKKNYYMAGTNWHFNAEDLIFRSISILLNKLSLSFFIFQLIVKSFFLFGFYLFIKKLFNYKIEYLFSIIFASMYLIPIVSINSLYQTASLGLFLIVVSFKNFNLLRDLPLLIIIVLMHKSGIAGLVFYFLNYFLQFRRLKIFKLASYFIIFLLIIFASIYFFNLGLIKSFIYSKLYILDDKISIFHYVWLLLYVIFSIIFFISKKDIKNTLSYKDYNFLISSILFLIFIIFVYSVSNQYALRFFYYEFIFFLFMVSLFPKIKILKFSILRSYFIATYIFASLFFVSIWYQFANEKKAFIEYRFNTNINFFCKKEQNCNDAEYLNFDILN